MKKKIALFMACICASSALFACGKQNSIESNTEVSDTSDTVEEKETTEDEVKDEEVKDEEATEQAAPTYAITSVAAEGYDNFTGKVECVQITDNNHPQLQTAVDDLFSEMVTSFNQSAESMNEEAVEQNNEMKEYADEDEDYEYYEMSYSRDITVEVIRSDSKVFSFLIYDYSFTGGAHGMTDALGYSFDVATGKQLEIEDFADKETITETAISYIISTIDESDELAKSNLYSDDATGEYAENIREAFEGDFYPEYYLSNTGIVFMFQQYSIAPYAAGILSFTVPYSVIEGFNEAYIPDDGFYSMELSNQGFVENFDVNNDGELEKVYLINDYEEEQAQYRLVVGDSSVSDELEEYGFAYGYYIHASDGNYVLVSNDGLNTLYSVTDGIKELGTVEIEGKVVKEIKDGEIVFAEITFTDAGSGWENPEVHKYSKLGLE